MTTLRDIIRKQQPSPAQMEYGNCRKLHCVVKGMQISVENPRVSVRSGVDRNGKEWSTLLHADCNPDRAVSFKEDSVKHICFVAETKDSMSPPDPVN
jgi:hypothetical protein